MRNLWEVLGLPPHRHAARLWRDGITAPARTRETVAACIEVCAHRGEIPRARWVVLQTRAGSRQLIDGSRQ